MFRSPAQAFPFVSNQNPYSDTPPSKARNAGAPSARPLLLMAPGASSAHIQQTLPERDVDDAHNTI